MIKTFEEFNNKTYGEIVEELYREDDYIKNVVNRFIGDIDPTIRISNAVNLLDKNASIELKHEIDRYQRDGLSSEVKVHLSGDISEEIELETSGRNVFRSFLKTISALGFKNIPLHNINPEEFIFYYQVDDIFIDDAMMIFNRFRSLNRYVSFLEHSENRINLYFGVNNTGELEYGVKTDGRKIIGKFKLNKSAKNWLLKIDTPSIKSLKSEIVNLNSNEIKIMGIIKNDLQNFYIESFKQKSKVKIEDSIISIGFHGMGSWNSGVLNDEDFIKYKNKFNNWILNKRWANKVTFKLHIESFWVHFLIKLK